MLIDEINSTKRTLSYPLAFEKTDLESLKKNVEVIKQALRVHGVVCIKNVYLDEAGLIELGERVGDELVVLPKELSFNNKDPKYPPLARIGNVLLDGSLKDSSKEATIWHQDGNFWNPADSYIFNMLMNVELPQSGGDTWFVDLVNTK
jgi:alpha-ketoglutarate-dependent taurine dioxygenase